ncbi:MAG TPA: hypothetical protein VF855_09240, partial [Acidimicrobiales bacterium]
MLEYAKVSSSSFKLDDLVDTLNERAADGWDVVAIVPTGGDVTAFLCREAAADEPAGLSDEAVEKAAEAPAAAGEAAPAADEAAAPADDAPSAPPVLPAAAAAAATASAASAPGPVA